MVPKAKRRPARGGAVDQFCSIDRTITATNPAPQVTRPIAAIRVGKRFRHDLGDVAKFATSIADVGLIHRIPITPDGKLISGERRLEACRLLGWTHVPVNVVDIDDIERAEIAENTERKDFLPSEIDAIRRAHEAKQKAAARKRMTLGGRGKKGAKVSQPLRATDKIGAYAGVSGRTVEKIAAVMDAAEAEPDRFGHLVPEMDRTGKVSAAHRELRRAQDEKRILGLAPVAGRFKTLVLDPPWQYDGLFLGRGGPDYATMPHEELLALPVPDWAEDNCHLYLWTTNAMFPDAIELMAKWGFRHNTVLTWAKPHYGLGTHFRGQTEHVIFGIRGTLATRCNSISTLFEAPVGKHSEKPEKFYEIVRAASYPPYGEAFQRKARPEFVNLFEQQVAREAAQ